MARKQTKSVQIGDYKAQPIRSRANGEEYWQVTIHLEGKRVTLGSFWALREEVPNRVIEMNKDPRNTVLVPSGSKAIITLGDLCDEWIAKGQSAKNKPKTLKNNKSSVEVIKKYAKERNLDTINNVFLADFQNQLFQDGFASYTVNAHMIKIVQIYRWGMERDYCPSVTLKRPAIGILRGVNDGNKTTPSKQQLDILINALSGWSKLCLILQASFGARIGEIAHLKWEQLNLKEGTAELDGKTGPRIVPIPKRARQALEEIDEDKRIGRVLADVAPLTVYRIAVDHWWKACTANGLPKYATSAARRYGCNTYYRTTKDPSVAAALLGHSPQTAMKHYRSVKLEEMRRAVEEADI